MGSLNRRLERLEGRIEPPEDEGAELRRAVMIKVLDEFSRLKASRATGLRGGVPIVPEDIPGQYLTKPYTTGQLVELAIERVWEREELPPLLMESWVQGHKALFAQQGWDWEKVEDDGN